jgi:hypothetical protein
VPYATAVREMSTGAGGAANERGAPALGCPLGVGVWLPVRDLDLRLDVNDPCVVAEVGRYVDRRGHADRRVDGRGGLGGGGEAEDGGCEPASDDGGKSELVHCGAFFFLSFVFEPWREVAVRRLCRPVMMVPLRRYNLQNTQVRVLIPVAVFGRWLAESGPRALNWTPMSDPGHAAGGGPHLANTSKVIDARAPHGAHLVSSCPARPGASLTYKQNVQLWRFARTAELSVIEIGSADDWQDHPDCPHASSSARTGLSNAAMEAR